MAILVTGSGIVIPDHRMKHGTLDTPSSCQISRYFRHPKAGDDNESESVRGREIDFTPFSN
jgi:hypothetical protein